MHLVEKMARAICARLPITWDQFDKEQQEEGLSASRAALQVVLDALREPSDGLMYAINNRPFDDRGPMRSFLDAIADHLVKE